MDILPNGLVNNVQHYITSSSEFVKIGIYAPKRNMHLVLKQFQMSAKQFTLIVHKKLALTP